MAQGNAIKHLSLALFLVVGGPSFYVSGTLFLDTHEEALTRPGDASNSEYVYWNDITGEMQQSNPGGIPYEDEQGNKYWMKTHSAKVMDSDPEAMQYVWLQKEKNGRQVYINQETQEMFLQRPVDLAWRLVKRPTGDSETLSEL